MKYCFSSVQLLSCVQLFVTPWTVARQASLSITNTWSLHKLMSITSVMPSNHLILCRSLLLLLSMFPSIRVFSKGQFFELAKVLKFQLQNQSFQRIFRVDFCKKCRGKKEPPLWTVGEGLYWAVALRQNSRGRVSKETKGVCEVGGVRKGFIARAGFPHKEESAGFSSV